jgi:tetraacyldisaccharide 4'-kinase
MRSEIENWLLRHWYGPHRPPWFLRALEPVYRSGFRRRQNKLQKPSNSYRPATPLIVVGNITAGGTGKTPLVIRLCELVRQLDLKAGVASTGYGRQSRETLLVRTGGDTGLYGDEPVLLAQRTGVPVVVAANRLDAVKVLDGMDLDIIFSDDGLQQASLWRDIEICVIDGSRGLGNGHLLPAGPLREPGSRLDRVDYVISNGQWINQPQGLEVHVMSLHVKSICSVDRAISVSVEEFLQSHAGTEIQAVAGIGNPERFFNTLKLIGIDARCREFSDHHAFTREDFDSSKTASAIIMTEKDAVKCRALALENAWYVAVDSFLPVELEQKLRDQIVKLTKESP